MFHKAPLEHEVAALEASPGESRTQELQSSWAWQRTGVPATRGKGETVTKSKRRWLIALQGEFNNSIVEDLHQNIFLSKTTSLSTTPYQRVIIPKYYNVFKDIWQ